MQRAFATAKCNSKPKRLEYGRLEADLTQIMEGNHQEQMMDWEGSCLGCPSGSLGPLGLFPIFAILHRLSISIIGFAVGRAPASGRAPAIR